MSRLDETILAKTEKRLALEQAGVNAYPYNFSKKQTIAQAIEYLNLDKKVQTAGRIMSLRSHGKVTFLNLRDFSGTIQVMLHATNLGKDYEFLTNIDTGDYLGIIGKVEKTKTGEITIIAEKMEFLGKALRPLPSAWNVAEDKEVRFRKRYLDMLINPRTDYVLKARWTILRELRFYLQNEGYVEVETPILQPLYGGTNAKPFTTHMNALDSDFYLRVAPELYLKRLIVGGMERIFEVARNFRNEGIDQTHQPEFTMVEWYEAYGDYRRMMEIIEGLIKHLNKAVNQSNILKLGEMEIDLDIKWPVYTIKEALEKFVDIRVDELSDDDLLKQLSKYELELIGSFSRGKAIFALFDKLVCDFLIEPTWIIDYPKEVSPLAKIHRIHNELTERYELYIGGKEISDGWSEITDPMDQRSRFENEQQKMRDGDEEAQPMDEEFLEALEYGLPPLGGVGIGIDRLVMLITNEWSIKETIAFPTLRPINRPEIKLNKAVAKPNSGDDKTVFDKTKNVSGKNLPSRAESVALLEKHVQNMGLRQHNYLVAVALEAYAKKLGEDPELWYQTGLLHDLDYEQHPDNHPQFAVDNWLVDYPEELREAILAHNYKLSGIEPRTLLDKYLIAVDELTGLMRATAMIVPDGFATLKVKSILKRMKEKAFAAAIDRDDIYYGSKLIETPLEGHVSFLVESLRDFKISK